MRYHSFKFDDGTEITGKLSYEVLEKNWKYLDIKDEVAGKLVADIGCWDGYNTIQALKCGAKHVVAMDNGLGSYNWQNDISGWQKNLDEVRERYGINEDRISYVYNDVDEEYLGYHAYAVDVVIAAGLIYHLKAPFKFLQECYYILKNGGILTIETHVTCNDIPYPAARFYPRNELCGDKSNWWGPNNLCVVEMLNAAGFSKVVETYTGRPTNTGGITNQRAFFKAYK